MKVKVSAPEKKVADVDSNDIAKLRALSSMYADKLFVCQWQTLIINMENRAKQGYSSEIYKNVDEKVGEMIRSTLKNSGFSVEVSGVFPDQIFLIRW